MVLKNISEDEAVQYKKKRKGVIGYICCTMVKAEHTAAKQSSGSVYASTGVPNINKPELDSSWWVVGDEAPWWVRHRAWAA